MNFFLTSVSHSSKPQIVLTICEHHSTGCCRFASVPVSLLLLEAWFWVNGATSLVHAESWHCLCIVILTQSLFFPSASCGQSLPSDWLLGEYVYVVPLPQVGTSSEAEFPFSVLLLDHTEATLHKMLPESTNLFSFFLFPVPLPPFSYQVVLGELP